MFQLFFPFIFEVLWFFLSTIFNSGVNFFRFGFLKFFLVISRIVICNIGCTVNRDYVLIENEGLSHLFVSNFSKLLPHFIILPPMWIIKHLTWNYHLWMVFSCTSWIFLTRSKVTVQFWLINFFMKSFISLFNIQKKLKPVLSRIGSKWNEIMKLIKKTATVGTQKIQIHRLLKNVVDFKWKCNKNLIIIFE